jgi:hypothetical protein
MHDSTHPQGYTPGPWAAVELYKGRWSVRAPRTPDKASPRNFFALVPAVGGDREHHRGNAFILATALELVEVARGIIRDHENLEDQAPCCAKCGSCNLGTGPHLRYCTYHAAKIAIAKIDEGPL